MIEVPEGYRLINEGGGKHLYQRLSDGAFFNLDMTPETIGVVTSSIVVIDANHLPQVGQEAWDGEAWIPVAVALSLDDCVARGYTQVRST